MATKQRKQKMFRLHWSTPVYSKIADKTVVGTSFFSTNNGFTIDDRLKIRNLKIGEKYTEYTPLGPGLIIRRIK